MNLIHYHQNRKNTYDICIRLKDNNNIKLLDHIFYIFTVIFCFTFKDEEIINLMSNDNLFCVL